MGVASGRTLRDRLCNVQTHDDHKSPQPLSRTEQASAPAGIEAKKKGAEAPF
jgi:hypothetical protein